MIASQSSQLSLEFHKSLAQYYIKWFQDCHDSAIYCTENNYTSRAAWYLNDASRYLTIIMENWNAIEFFTNNPDKAFIYDELLPKEFQGYR